MDNTNCLCLCGGTVQTAAKRFRLQLHQHQCQPTPVYPEQFCRKERTGNLDEVQISDIKSLQEKYTEIEKRRESIINTIEKMGKLHVKNIDFLLDDFGTGYSSLSYLHKLPIWLLKIDKSFVTDIYSNQNDTQAIVNAILVMAEQLGIKCIVEGIEHQEEMDFFKLKGVHGMQGFIFHKPMRGEMLQTLLHENHEKSKLRLKLA